MKLKKGEILTLKVDSNAFGGKGIAKLSTDKGEYVIFIPNTIAGQTIEARVIRNRKAHTECALVKVLERSANEISLPYQSISGAPFITLPASFQKAIKEEQTLDLYKKIGRLKDMESCYDGYVESPLLYHYRNKMEYSFSAIGYDVDKKEEFDGFALGFKKRGTWWCVENLNKDSGLFDKEVEDKLKLIRTYCEETALPAWHPPQKKGFFRYLVMRKSYHSNRLIMKLVTSSSGIEQFDLQKFSTFMQSLFSERLEGLIHTINDDIGDNAQSRWGKETLLHGQNIITEQLLGLTFEISMQSFFQTNPTCAALLYEKVIEYTLDDYQPSPQDVILDLFCGTGTIAQIIAAKTKLKTIGVDIVEDAIKDAKRNAIKNNISNTNFYAEDVGQFLLHHPEYNDNINTVIIDPPRSGIAKKTLSKIIALNAKQLIYVSCNPSTQARDSNLLTEAGYFLKKFSLVDQFPHTSHIESVALFTLKK